MRILENTAFDASRFQPLHPDAGSPFARGACDCSARETEFACQRECMTTLAPSEMEFLESVPRGEFPHCWRHTLPLHGCCLFLQQIPRQGAPRRCAHHCQRETLLVCVWTQKFQRGRLWPRLRPVRVGQDRATVLLAFLMICAVRYDTIRDDMIYGTCSQLWDI